MSKCRHLLPILIVAEFASVRFVFQVQRSGDGSIPFIHADLASLLSGLQAIINLGVFFLGRRCGDALLRFFFVGTDFAAGALGFTGSQIVAIAGVISGSKQKELPAIPAAPWGISGNQSPIEINK